MPTYLYRCETCQKEFEHEHSITEELQECPVCKAKPTKLIAGGTGFILSGGVGVVQDIPNDT